MITTSKHPLVGTALKKILERLFIKSAPGCGCDAMANMMNNEGPDWCKQHQELIVDKMERGAEKRGLPFTRTGAALLLKLAHAKAQRDFNRKR